MLSPKGHAGRQVYMLSLPAQRAALWGGFSVFAEAISQCVVTALPVVQDRARTKERRQLPYAVSAMSMTPGYPGAKF